MTDEPIQDDDTAPGWDAINAALKPIYGDQEPKHFGTIIKWMLGGPDPLDGISAYKRLEPVPHWHCVSYGLSELYSKESDYAEESGFGFEFSFRLACDAAAVEPPNWPMSLMQNLARYVFQSGNVFAAGHWINLNGPIALETDTKLCSVAFVEDPELGEIDTPHGKVTFLQIVGLTQDEEDAGKQWNARKLLASFAPHMPLFITDVSRGSLMGESAVQQALAAGIREDGSSTGQLYTDVLAWSIKKPFLRSAVTTIELGAAQVEQMRVLLPARLPHDRDFMIVGNDKMAIFTKGAENSVVEKEGSLAIALTPDTMATLVREVQPRAGVYDIPGMDLKIAVKQTNIRDKDGNIVEVIG